MKLIKGIIYVFTVCVIVLALNSCGAARNSQYNNPPGYISMTVTPAASTEAPGKLDLMIANNSEQTAQFGANYTIERYVDGEWVEFQRPPFAVIAVMYILQPGDSQVYQLGMYPETVDYTAGRYRVVKSIYLDITGATYYTAEFRIGK